MSKAKTMKTAKPEMISADGLKTTETLMQDQDLQRVMLSTINCIWEGKTGGKVTAKAPVRFDKYVVGHCPTRTSVGIKVTTYGDGLKMVRTADAFPKVTRPRLPASGTSLPTVWRVTTGSARSTSLVVRTLNGGICAGRFATSSSRVVAMRWKPRARPRLTSPSCFLSGTTEHSAVQEKDT